MERNGDSRNKRKPSPSSDLERPSKQLKPEVSGLINGDAITPTNEPFFGLDGGKDEDYRMTTMPSTGAADSAEWQATIEKVVKNVVSIHFCQTCSFDTDAACSSEATGFVVDAEKGYILTNRHVVGAGPFWGYCIFDNHEEVCSPVFILPYRIFTNFVISAMSTLSIAILSTTSEFCASTPRQSSTCP